MHRFGGWFLALLVVSAAVIVAAQAKPQPAPAPPGGGWQIPDGAKDEKSPMETTPRVLAQGKDLFKEHCQRCHGAEGKGNGPDADPGEKPDDLSDASRAERNPDGVMFYKMWNGRQKPKMPAFKTKVTRDEGWMIVLYAKTLRKPH